MKQKVCSMYSYIGSQVVDPDAFAAMNSAVATDSLISIQHFICFIGVHCPATSIEAPKLPGDSED